ncbi:zinc knuckle CX2CX4HX4C containing protein [Tanacetum coccineum]
MAEDASSKKFLVSNFNNYKMIDFRPVMEQFNELFRILGQYTQHGLKMDESISVSSVIDKLRPSWKDFKHTLKHGKDNLSLVQLDSHLRIEESQRAQKSDKGKETKRWNVLRKDSFDIQLLGFVPTYQIYDYVEVGDWDTLLNMQKSAPIVDDSLSGKASPSDPIVQCVDINTKSTSYVGAAGVSAKDQPKVNYNFRPLVADLVFDGVNISIPRKVVENAKHGLKRITMNTKCFFFFKFDSRACLEAVLEGGPWLIQADLVDVVTIGIPSLTEDGFNKETIRVEYEWRSSKCDICKIFSHVHDHCPKKVSSSTINKRKGKSKSTNSGQFAGPSVKQFVRYEPKATTNAPKKGATNVSNASKSSSLLKTTSTSSKKDNITTSNSYSALNEDEDEEEDVENVCDESANLFPNTKTGGSSSSRLLLSRVVVRDIAYVPQAGYAGAGYDSEGGRRGHVRRKRRAIQSRKYTTSTEAKKTKSESSSGTAGSQTAMFADTMQNELRFKRESQQEKDRTMIKFEELRYPSAAADDVSRRQMTRQPALSQITPAGFASMLLGISLALMLCGSITFLLGFLLMPWVFGLVMLFYVCGIVSSLTMLGRAVFSLILPPPHPHPRKAAAAAVPDEVIFAYWANGLLSESLETAVKRDSDS